MQLMLFSEAAAQSNDVEFENVACSLAESANSFFGS